jgi:Flavodoxin
MMKALVVYYSLSGNTRTVAKVLARDLAADTEELHCPRYASGVWGYMRAGYDSWKGNLPPIEKLTHTPLQYELVVVAGPIWAFHPATPVRTFLKPERTRLPRVAFLLTHGGSAGERCLREMEEIAGQAPIATSIVRQQDVKGRTFACALASFETKLQKPTPPGIPPSPP